jgi:hypothetical protein
MASYVIVSIVGSIGITWPESFKSRAEAEAIHDGLEAGGDPRFYRPDTARGWLEAFEDGP